MTIAFWFIFFIIVYAYVGYFAIMWLVSSFFPARDIDKSTNIYEPTVSLIVAAYNEEGVVIKKLANSAEIDYSRNKIEQIWVTDGSTDASVAILSANKEIKLLHLPERMGKINAINRAVSFAKNDIIIFSDANSMLSTNVVKEIVSIFSNPKVGCVAGSKQVVNGTVDNQAMGEGLYWEYEALLKKFESKIGSTIGAAGELFAIRRELFEIVEPDTILDDFVIAMRVALKGYYVKYADRALAVEVQSASIVDEMKRKIRISAGGFQTLFRMSQLHNPFKQIGLVFKFYSHKVLRWLVVPFVLPLLLLLNFIIVHFNDYTPSIYLLMLVLQICFYILALAGNFLPKNRFMPRWLFFPYYFLIVNYCQVLGLIRYLNKKQSVKWEKATRASN